MVFMQLPVKNGAALKVDIMCVEKYDEPTMEMKAVNYSETWEKSQR